VFFLSPFRAWELLVGSLLAFNAVPIIRSRALREVIAGVGLLAILFACFAYDAKTTFPGFAALLPVLGAAAIMHAGASGSSLVGGLLQWRPVVYVGLISYSLYLWHWPLIVLTRYAMGMEPIAPYIPLLFVASLLLGSLSYHLVEQPFRRIDRVSRRLIFSSSAVVTLALVCVSGIGLVQGGFVTRFTPEVVELDQSRSPQIPFVNCDEKPVGTGCLLGRSDRAPSILLWGDSHLLAWAPVLNENLNQVNIRAVFVPTSACPPMLGVDNSAKVICHTQNLAVKNYLLAHPEIKTVIMSAYWSTYFRQDGPLTVHASSSPVSGIEAAKHGLESTIRWLRSEGRQVALIGPVPVYDKSVPLGLALEKATGRQFLRTTSGDQVKKHATFFDVVDSEQRASDGVNFRFLNPIDWMCVGECTVMKDRVPLYRDSHHLSVAGAMALQDKLDVEFMRIFTKNAH
jgi:SGNH domain (fused to AT3 domains)